MTCINVTEDNKIAEAGVELTILMPCLNEEVTLGRCIDAAQEYLAAAGCSGEVLVADNGSTDNSPAIAREHGARVVLCSEKGYGNALRGGISAARGSYIIFGDCDLSYDFRDIHMFHEKLREGYELVIGNRFAEPPSPEAMPFSHRVGVPVLSWIARMRYHSDVRDFHCGLRGCRKSSVEKLSLRTEGMEFATEMIGRACKANLKIGQVPITLYPDGRSGKSHLRTVRDGFRHLFFVIKPL